MLELRTMDGAKLEVTEEERVHILNAVTEKRKFVNLSRTGNTIFLASISGIYAKSGKQLTEGRLHDGTRVIKKFGRWVDANNPNVSLDAGYYPEIARDEVMSEAEFVSQQEALPEPAPLLENNPNYIDRR